MGAVWVLTDCTVHVHNMAIYDTHEIPAVHHIYHPSHLPDMSQQRTIHSVGDISGKDPRPSTPVCTYTYTGWRYATDLRQATIYAPLGGPYAISTR